MTRKELHTLLKSSGYSVGHIEFSKPQKPPYIAYTIDGEEQRGSDFQNLIKETSTRVELYTEYNDSEAEGKLDEILSFTAFSKDRVKISEERLLMTIYEFDEISKLLV